MCEVWSGSANDVIITGVSSYWPSHYVRNHASCVGLDKSHVLTYVVTVCVGEKKGMAEMVTYLPISSPFIRFAGNYVDQAFGFAAGWNFFVFEAALVPFEITACNLIIHFWSDA